MLSRRIIVPSCDPHLAGVVQNTEHQLLFELFGFGELHVTRVGVQQLVHEGHIGGFGEPALLVQQGQDAWRVVLQRICSDYYTVTTM